MTSVFARSRKSTVPDARQVWLGQDEWATDRFLNMAGVPGFTCGGLPGYGKTSLSLSVLVQLAPSSAHQFVILDGKGGGDYEDWFSRCWLFGGDDLDTAVSHLEECFTEMRRRQRCIRAELGTTNFWDVGPTASWPLLFVLVDECHTFFPKSGKKDDRLATCEDKIEQLIKKGRSVGVCVLLSTQKQTGDSIPTNIRDVCGIGLSFACKTSEAAKAALGEGIRDYPSACPTTLQDDAYIGVCVGSLPRITGFIRLRVPYVSPNDAGNLARATAHLRRDLSTGDNGNGSEPVSVPA